MRFARWGLCVLLLVGVQGIHAGKAELIDFKLFAAADASSKEMLKLARSDARTRDKALSKALRSKEAKDILGALSIVDALASVDHLKLVTKLLEYDNAKIAYRARAVLVNLPGDKASKAVLQEWRRLEKSESESLKDYAQLVARAAFNLKTYDWLQKQSSEQALSVAQKLKKRYQLSDLDLEMIKELTVRAKNSSKGDREVPLFVPGQMSDLCRYGNNLELTSSSRLECDLSTGVERSKKQGMLCRVWVLLRGESPLIRFNLRDDRGWGFEFQLEEDSYAALGSQTQRVINEMQGRWIEVVFAWMPFQDGATANMYCTIDGRNGFDRNATALWTSTRVPQLRVDVDQASAILADGGIEVIDRLP